MITNDQLNFQYFLNLLKKIECFEYVGPNYYLSCESFSGNINYSQRSIINNSLPYERIYINDAKAFLSNYDLEYVNVGVLDRGVDNTHIDLINKVSSLSQSYLVNGNPYVELDPYSPHGTPISGIIVANNATLNKISINDYAAIVSLQHEWSITYNDHFSSEPYLSNSTHIIDAINYANENDIRIINLSTGYEIEEFAIKIAISNYNGLFICSAGNSGYNLDEDPVYPACYNLNNVITVGGMTNDYRPCNNTNSDFNTNYSINYVDLFAPSFGIYTTTINNSYDYFSGTSFAAPFVTGVASLILSIEEYCNINTNMNLSFSGEDLKYIICNSVSLDNDLRDYCIYGGFVNALDAIQYALTYNPILGYEYYDDFYHKTMMPYEYRLEEHTWSYNSLNSTFAVNPTPIRLVCSKCGATKI